MQIKLVKCKTALSASKLPGLDYSLNPYKGCQHKCTYCYVPNILRVKRENWGEFVEIKSNIPNILAEELKRKKPGVVALSTVTDPYQPIEKKYKLSRYCLEQLLKSDFPVSIQTKSDLILRDIDLIQKLSDVEVIFSIGTLKEGQRKILEPNASKIQNRLQALKNISDLGIKTMVFFGPIYPTIKKENVIDIISTFQDFGAERIMIDRFNLKQGIKENLKQKISENNSLTSTFNKRIFQDSSYYNEIREEIMKVGKQKKIPIFDAF